MKLLPPKELNTKIQEQKSSEIKAGMFLAKKVDALREEVQMVQVGHDRAIEEMKNDYQIFITEQSEKRGVILKEIEELTEKKRILQIPLDAEWKKVKEQSDSNSRKDIELIVREENVKRDEESISAKLLKIYSRETSLGISEKDTENSLFNAEELERKAQENFDRSRILKENIEKDSAERESALKKRDTDLAYRELDIENKWQNTLIKQGENEKETKRIESKQRQLSAAFAELEKRNEQS